MNENGSDYLTLSQVHRRYRMPLEVLKKNLKENGLLYGESNEWKIRKEELKPLEPDLKKLAIRFNEDEFIKQFIYEKINSEDKGNPYTDKILNEKYRKYTKWIQRTTKIGKIRINLGLADAPARYIEYLNYIGNENVDDISLSNIRGKYHISQELFTEILQKNDIPADLKSLGRISRTKFEKLLNSLIHASLANKENMKFFIREIIEGENKEEPYSDVQVGELLYEKTGIVLDRKTSISDIRKGLGYADAFERYFNWLVDKIKNEQKSVEVVTGEDDKFIVANAEIRNYSREREIGIIKKDQKEFFFSKAEVCDNELRGVLSTYKEGNIIPVIFGFEVNEIQKINFVIKPDTLHNISNNMKALIDKSSVFSVEKKEGIKNSIISAIKYFKKQEFYSKKVHELILVLDKKMRIGANKQVVESVVSTNNILQFKEISDKEFFSQEPETFDSLRRIVWEARRRNLTDGEMPYVKKAFKKLVRKCLASELSKTLRDLYEYEEKYINGIEILHELPFDDVLSRSSKTIVSGFNDVLLNLKESQVRGFPEHIQQMYLNISNKVDLAIRQINVRLTTDTNKKKERKLKFRLYELYALKHDFEAAKKTLLELAEKSINRGEKRHIYSTLHIFCRKIGQKEDAKSYKELRDSFPSWKELKEQEQQEQIAHRLASISSEEIRNRKLVIIEASPLLTIAIKNCKYEGIPKGEEVTQNTISDLQKQIDERTVIDESKRYTEGYAELYLVQACVFADLGLDKTEGFNEALKKYAFSKAMMLRSIRQDWELCAEYFYCGAALEKKRDNMTKQAVRFIKTMLFFKGSNVDQPIPVLKEELSSLLERESFYWNYLILLGSYAKGGFNFILKLLAQNPAGYQRTQNYLSRNFDYDESLNLEQNFEKIFENHKKQKQNFNETVNLFLAQNKLVDFINLFKQRAQSFDIDILLKIDRDRLRSLRDMVQIILNFLNAEKFEAKSLYFDDFVNKSFLFEKTINEQPTNLSLGLLLPLAEHIQKLFQEKYLEVLDTARPIVDLVLEGDCVVNEYEECDVYFVVTNQLHCSQVSDIVVSLLEPKPANSENHTQNFATTLNGGQSQSVKMTLAFPTEVIQQGATDIQLSYRYRDVKSDEIITKKKTLSISFSSSSDFVKIKNPYSGFVKSNIVEDPNMFFGRAPLIERIYETIMSVRSKGYVLYGQKRSGKSSVLWHLGQKFDTDPNAFAISLSLGLAITEDGNSEANFYYQVLRAIQRKLRKYELQRINVPKISKVSLDELLKSPLMVFYDKLEEIKLAFQAHEAWRGRKLILIIDEFTYLYYAIKKERIPATFMKNWKAFIEDNGFSVVIAGQDAMKQFMLEFPNEFGMFKAERLTYLDEASARELIDKPVWDSEKNRSRYTRNGTDKILSLTAGSPFYIQIICNALVCFMNNNRKSALTPRDIDEVVSSLCQGPESLSESIDFDNLLSAGDKECDIVKAGQAKAILREVAKQTQILEYANRHSISVFSEKEDTLILNDLLERTIIQKDGGVNRYRIVVQLFKEWLNSNYN